MKKIFIKIACVFCAFLPFVCYVEITNCSSLYWFKSSSTNLLLPGIPPVAPSLPVIVWFIKTLASKGQESSNEFVWIEQSVLGSCCTWGDIWKREQLKRHVQREQEGIISGFVCFFVFFFIFCLIRNRTSGNKRNTGKLILQAEFILLDSFLFQCC